ncbi:uncharacterized protein LOC120189356 [Hibiscus syriacus]|uniref:uncharacterized protein LOC120189356 n=1 Tax=Hibiscus syriacus TaxID=106335 RepID=UPI001921111A|nr:uncharacterized protein LOC120189356 [Hibiscus syriacus]
MQSATAIRCMLPLLSYPYCSYFVESNVFLKLMFFLLLLLPLPDLSIFCLFLQEQIFSENDAFFALTFEKRRPLWQTLLSFVWPMLTLAICLFPVYPHRCKLPILYSSAGLLVLILSLLLLRAAIFGAAWIVLGKRVWFFPNILAEEVTLRELFCVWPKKDEEERPKWTARLFYAILVVLVILLLRHHAPDEASRARSVPNLLLVLRILYYCSMIFSKRNRLIIYIYIFSTLDVQKKMSNIIGDVLEWSPSLLSPG